MKYFLTTLLAIAFLTACKTSKDGVMLLMETSKGDMKIKLYDETPLHRDNIVKLANQGYYDSLLFHRVINEFMIQAGDPDSKNAAPDAVLGDGGPGYTIEAEINYPKLFHKKGALAAARSGDDVNPQRRSSGSQFYIVQGKTLNDEEFKKVEARLTSMKKKKLLYQTLEGYKDTLMQLQKEGNQAAFMDLKVKIETIVEEKMAGEPDISIPEEIKEVYRTVGGTPHLDDNYTVFGEVVEGLEIIDAIAGVEKGRHNRPVEDVYIIKMKVVRK